MRPNPKPRIEGLSECGVERVQVGECGRGDPVEGQSAGWPVQVHSYSAGAGGGDRYVSAFIIVPGIVTVRRAPQTPGLGITSQCAVITLPFPLDAFIRHSYMSPPPTPLSLPVAASRQTLPTHRGGLGEKSGPGVTVRPAHSVHGALPTQCIARIDQSVAYLEKYPYT